jgi:hypothetical protein
MTFRLFGTLILAGALASLLFACSQRPNAILPRNEAQTPIFYPGHRFALGLSAGPIWYQKTPEFPQDPPVKGFGQAIKLEFEPDFNLNWTPWASSGLLPIYWSFLLTGDQYEGENLKTGKLHLTLGGGAEIAYDGAWTVGTGLDLTGKILFTPRFYGILGASGVFPQSDDYFVGSGIAQVGHQLTEKLSLAVFGTHSLIVLPEGYYTEQMGAFYTDGDHLSQVGIRSLYYFGRNHILGPTVSAMFRNGAAGDPHQYRVALTYTYVAGQINRPPAP